MAEDQVRWSTVMGCMGLYRYTRLFWSVLLCYREYYGFDQDFPHQQMLTRSETGKKRNLYFVSRLVRELTIVNECTVKVISILLLQPTSKVCIHTLSTIWCVITVCVKKVCNHCVCEEDVLSLCV